MDFDDWSGDGDGDGFDAWGDGDGDDGRGAWAEAMGAPDDARSEGEIGAAQWSAAFGDFVDSGQISQEQADALANLSDDDFDAWGAAVETDAPDGDTP